MEGLWAELWNTSGYDKYYVGIYKDFKENHLILLK